MTRYLIAGHDLGKWTFLSELDCTQNPEDTYDIVCLLPGADAEGVAHQLLKNRRLLAPVLDFSGAGRVRSDFAGSEPSLTAISSATETLRPLLKSVSDLNQAIAGSSDYRSLAILGLAHTRNSRINAVRNAGLTELIEYPLLAGIVPQRRLLEELTDYGLLDREHFDRIYFCEQCGSSRLHVREECRSCRSSNLQDVSLVHHYRCGFQGVETAFRQREQLQCPKCQKELRHYGVDYDKPAVVHSCGACHEISSDPAIGFICGDCSKHADAENVATREWFHYVITPSGVAALQAGVLPQNAVQALLSKSVGICSVGEFSTTAAHLLKIAGRFHRPLCACAIHIADYHELTGRFGVSSLAGAFLLLGEIIAQILRNTDLVCVRQQTIYLLLAETDIANLQVVESRLRQQSSDRISVPLKLDIDRYDASEMQDLLRKLG